MLTDERTAREALMPQTTENYLEVRNLSIAYSTPNGEKEVVSELSFSLARGETLAIVGESGSGKSTTALAIAGLLPSNSRVTNGSVTLGGVDLLSLSSKAWRRVYGRQIGYVPQDPTSNLDPLIPIGQQVAETIHAHERVSKATARKRAEELLEIVGIPQPHVTFDQLPNEFSGGMRQRVLIAAALACKPALVIADEPTSSLDVTVQRRVLDQFTKLTAGFGTSVLFITHNLAVAAERADRIVVLHNGVTEDQGGPGYIANESTVAYTRQLIESIPDVERNDAVVRHGSSSEPLGERLVTVSNVAKTYPAKNKRSLPRLAVSEITFDVHEGETVSLVGESGSGKSTTANIVLGLSQASDGYVEVLGQRWQGLDRSGEKNLRKMIQPVFQNPYSSLNPRMSIGEIIGEPLLRYGMRSASERQRIVDRLLDEVALAKAMKARYPYQLSGGQQQRVAIARALSLSPKILVLDEALSALDVVVQHQILEILARLKREEGVSYLFISHDLTVVEAISDNVCVMHNGRIVERGTPAAIFSNPQTDYTRTLLDAVPRLPAATTGPKQS